MLSNCKDVKNITVSVDDETYRRARIKAAERNTSVSKLVKTFLSEMVLEESDLERRKRLQREAIDRIHSFRASDRLDRDAVHDRRAIS